MTLLPGFVLYALAFAGLFFSVWRLRHRLLLLAGVLVHDRRWRWAPRFFDGTFDLPAAVRAPAGLRRPAHPGPADALDDAAARRSSRPGAVTAFAERAAELSRAAGCRRGRAPWLRLATLMPLLLVLVEGAEHDAAPGRAGPAGGDAHGGRAAAGAAQRPELIDHERDALVDRRVPDDRQRRQRLHAATSSTTPPADAQSFPDQASVDYLRELGVRTVVRAARPGGRHAVRDDDRRADRRPRHQPRRSSATRWSSGC